MNKLLLRPLTLPDKQAILQWPAYPPEFIELDYALRANGWLDEFMNRPDNWLYAVELNKNLVAFTLLATTGKNEAELRIALHPHYLGKGLGKAATLRTMDAGFSNHGLIRIHLIVRKNNTRAIKLYAGIGFKFTGSCIKQVNKLPVEFHQMEYLKENYRG